MFRDMRVRRLVDLVLELVVRFVVELRLRLRRRQSGLIDRLARREIRGQWIAAHNRPKRLPLLTSNLARVGTGPPFELQMLADRFIEQSHQPKA
jgi:hypothetical protein